MRDATVSQAGHHLLKFAGVTRALKRAARERRVHKAYSASSIRSTVVPQRKIRRPLKVSELRILQSGAEEARTPDLLYAIQALSQLSYSPLRVAGYHTEARKARQVGAAKKTKRGKSF